MGVVQHSDTPDEHAKIFYLDGVTKISEGSTVVVYMVSDVGSDTIVETAVVPAASQGVLCRGVHHFLCQRDAFLFKPE
jgi:hypothetical protein